MNPLDWSFKTWLIVGSIAAGLGAVWLYGHHQYNEGYADKVAEDDAAEVLRLTNAIGNLTGRVDEASKNGAALASNLSNLDAAVDKAKKDIRNVVPPRESDVACNLPATARSLQNSASGYRD